MSLNTLKLIRLVAPGFIIVFFCYILGKFTGLWYISLPDNLEKAIYAPCFVILGAIYYLTPLRSWANERHHNRLTQYLRVEIVKISEIVDRPEKFTWQNLKVFFFKLIDSDDGLTKKASLAYFNGAIWTTCADVTVIALIFEVISIDLYIVAFIHKIPRHNIFMAMVIFALIFIIAYLGSLSTTKRQIEIASEQIEIMRSHFKDEIVKRISELER